MKKNDKIREELLLEVEKLRGQLAEAEETLRAIRGGEVDAFVLSGEKGEQVFTLKGAEKPYRILIEEMKEGAVTLGADNSILYCNSGFARMLKTPLEKLIGTSIAHYISPADAEVFEELLQRGIEESKNREISFVAGDGTHVPTYLSLNSVQQENMALINLIAIDLTEQKRAEEELRRVGGLSMESKERYRELAESIGEVFYAMDRNLRYTYWNNASETLTGILAKDAIGKSLFELFPELNGTRTERLYRELLKTQQPQHFVSRYRAGDKTLTFEINAFPSKFGLSVIAKDITEHRRSEELIREQAALLDKARDTIAVWDLEHRLIYWNKGAQNMYGWTAEEALGKNADELLYKEESPKLIEARKTVIEKGEWIGELDQVTKKGKEIIVESSWTLVQDIGGRPKSILIINTDITEKKKIEMKFLRAQRMEGIGTLAAGIAHDINNILTPIMLSVQILRDKFKDEQSRTLLDIIERNTKRGADLMKQVLSFSRGVKSERNSVKVTYIISEIEKVAKETFPKSIEIRIRISKDLKEVIGDATQLHQVLMNLCLNAREAMSERGILNISAENLFIDENHPSMNIEARVGQYVVITISDTGTGIPPEIMDRIFEPFFTTKEPGKGTGLGLSTSLGIVKSHGGFIDLHSEVGKGTTFKVYLPAATTTGKQEVEAQLELHAGNGETVLIVDDEVSIRDATRVLLEKNGYNVITANDGVEAISLYKKNKNEIKVVLMDMAMPVMGGPACIQALRKISPDVNIIAVSGLIQNETFSKVADYVTVTLPKPYTAEKLLKTIHEVERKTERKNY